jgi:hypothetical protein
MSVIGTKRTIPRLSAIGDKADIEDDTFRKEKVAQRPAVLKSAAWLISLLEQVIGTE